MQTKLGTSSCQRHQDSVSKVAEILASGSLGAHEKMDTLWRLIRACPAETVNYPAPTTLLEEIRTRDYSTLIDYTGDIYPDGIQKVICSAGGAVAAVKLEWCS